MKLRSILLAAAIVMTPLAAYAASQLSDFPLAERIKAKIESGKPLDIYVSYHDSPTSSRHSSSQALKRRARKTR